MQQMLRLMLSMQIDMQRSLRQEVAGALANTSITTTSSQLMNAGHCTICLNAIADTVLYRCGHLCVCYLCGLNLRETTSTTGIRCPICRAPVDDILRIYRSSRDGEQ
jgi:protein neuralized